MFLHYYYVRASLPLECVAFAIYIYIYIYTHILCWTWFYIYKIKFSISTLFSSIWPIDRTLSGATTLSQSGTGSDGNKGILLIPQSSSITDASPSDCLVLYPEHSMRESYPFAEMQSVYSRSLADWARTWKGPIYESNRNVRHLNWVETNDLC